MNTSTQPTSSSSHHPVESNSKLTVHSPILQSSTNSHSNRTNKENEIKIPKTADMGAQYRLAKDEIESACKLQLECLNQRLSQEINSNNQLKAALEEAQNSSKNTIEKLQQDYVVKLDELTKQLKISNEDSAIILSKANADHAKVLERHQQDKQFLEGRVAELDKELKAAQESNQILEQARNAFLHSLSEERKQNAAKSKNIEQMIVGLQSTLKQKIDVANEAMKQAQLKLEKIKVEHASQETVLTLKINELEGNIKNINQLSDTEKKAQAEQLNYLNREVLSLKQQLGAVSEDLKDTKERETRLQNKLILALQQIEADKEIKLKLTEKLNLVTSSLTISDGDGLGLTASSTSSHIASAKATTSTSGHSEGFQRVMEILSSTNVILQSVINRQAEMEASVRASQQEQKLPLVAISDLKKINIETNPVSYGDPILNQYGISTSTGAMTGSPHSGVLCPNPINRTKCTSMS